MLDGVETKELTDEEKLEQLIGFTVTVMNRYFWMDGTLRKTSTSYDVKTKNGLCTFESSYSIESVDIVKKTITLR